MPLLEHKGLEFEVKTIDTSERIIEGYAAIAETMDRVSDIIDKKAFTRVESKPPGDVSVLIAHHLDSLPVGIPLEIRFDGKGLWTKTKVFKTTAGDDLLAVCAELKEHGRSLGMSIGYKALEAARERTDEGKTARRLLDVDIKEYSFAPAFTIAHPDALVSDVKAMSEGFDSAGGYLSPVAIEHMRAEHTKHCKDKDCPLAIHESDEDDEDGTKTISFKDWFVKCGVMGSDGYYRRDDIMNATQIINSITSWLESEMQEGDSSNKHARSLYRALVTVTNTLRSEIDEYYAAAGSETPDDDEVPVVDELGGKTEHADYSVALEMLDIELALIHSR